MSGSTSYTPPPALDMPAKHLVVDAGGPHERRYTFFDRIEIRRQQPDPQPGVVLVDDSTVSSQHCVITQAPDGHCFVRDLSRNGTRLDGRRLVPNIEVEMTVGQVLSVGQQTQFRLEGEAAGGGSSGSRLLQEPYAGTTDQVESRTVTVLVGDIRDYTGVGEPALRAPRARGRAGGRHRQGAPG
jgi:pSer/pThr/pTyr-binding forkhead associated (FHA) protein